MKNDANAVVSGKVDGIEAGKDGYTAKITTDAKEAKKYTLQQLVL
ncbi:hypothetical protein AAYQ05_20025 [Flavobacterium sp. B11]